MSGSELKNSKLRCSGQQWLIHSSLLDSVEKPLSGLSFMETKQDDREAVKLEHKHFAVFFQNPNVFSYKSTVYPPC